VTWTVRFAHGLADWFRTLPLEVKVALGAHMDQLRQLGPGLGMPFARKLKGTDPPLYELRAQVNGEPWRVLYAYQPDRAAILLVGGMKSSDSRFKSGYQRIIAVAHGALQRDRETKE
jgi:hypothetical protein